MKVDFVHEMVHGILDHLGYSNHDEKKVDEMAKALYMVFEDNPKLFEKEETDGNFKRNDVARRIVVLRCGFGN